MLDVNSLLKRLSELSKLEYNWDGDNAFPIHEDILRSAYTFIYQISEFEGCPTPNISPVPSISGLQFNFIKKISSTTRYDLEVEFLNNYKVICISAFWRNPCDPEMKTEAFKFRDPEFIKYISICLPYLK